MGLLIRSHHGKMNTMAISCQDLSQDCSKILLRNPRSANPGSQTISYKSSPICGKYAVYMRLLKSTKIRGICGGFQGKAYN